MYRWRAFESVWSELLKKDQSGHPNLWKAPNYDVHQIWPSRKLVSNYILKKQWLPISNAFIAILEIGVTIMQRDQSQAVCALRLRCIVVICISIWRLLQLEAKYFSRKFGKGRPLLFPFTIGKHNLIYSECVKVFFACIYRVFLTEKVKLELTWFHTFKLVQSAIGRYMCFAHFKP